MSLGLTSAAADATGGHAITFRATGLHPMCRGGMPLPNAAGMQIPHSARWYHGSLQHHLVM